MTMRGAHKPPVGKSVGKDDLSSKEKALCCARLGLEKKAQGMTILNTGPLTSLAEYFVICSGSSVRHTRAISEHIKMQGKKRGFRILGLEGISEGSWILLDYDDVVVHVFHEPTRELYSLEKLWSDAHRVVDAEIRQAQAQVDQDNQKEGDWDL